MEDEDPDVLPESEQITNGLYPTLALYVYGDEGEWKGTRKRCLDYMLKSTAVSNFLDTEKKGLNNIYEAITKTGRYDDVFELRLAASCFSRKIRIWAGTSIIGNYEPVLGGSKDYHPGMNLENMRIVQKYARGKGFRAAYVEGDGSCYYRSLSLLIEGTQDKFHNFRLAMSIEINKNWDRFYSKLQNADEEGYGSKKEMCHNVLRKDFWAGHREWRCTPNALSVSLNIHLLDLGKVEDLTPETGAAPLQTIDIVYFRKHFYPLLCVRDIQHSSVADIQTRHLDTLKNGFYQTVAVHVYGDEGQWVETRQRCMDFMLKNPGPFEQFLKDNMDIYSIYDIIIATGRYDDTFELNLAASCFNREICIWTGNMMTNKYEPLIGGPEGVMNLNYLNGVYSLSHVFFIANCPLHRPEMNSENMRVVQNYAREKGFRTTYVEGDGSCYYRSLSLLMEGTQDKYNNFRLAMSKEIRKNWENSYANLQNDKEEGYRSKEEMCNYVLRPDFWAGDREWRCTPNAFSVNLNIHMLDIGKIEHITPEAGAQQLQTLDIVYYKFHFYPLLRVTERQTPSIATMQSHPPVILNLVSLEAKTNETSHSVTGLLKKKGLSILNLKTTNGSGLFEAAAHFLRGNAELAERLRSELVSELETDQKNLRISNVSAKKAARRIKNGRQLYERTEAQFISAVYGVQCVVFIITKSAKKPGIRREIYKPTILKVQSTIHLLHDEEKNHYELLVPQNDTEHLARHNNSSPVSVPEMSIVSQSPSSPSSFCFTEAELMDALQDCHSSPIEISNLATSLPLTSPESSQVASGYSGSSNEHKNRGTAECMDCEYSESEVESSLNANSQQPKTEVSSEEDNNDDRVEDFLGYCDDEEVEVLKHKTPTFQSVYTNKSDSDNETDDDTPKFIASVKTKRKRMEGPTLGLADRYGYHFLANKVFGYGRASLRFCLLLPRQCHRETFIESVTAAKGKRCLYFFTYSSNDQMMAKLKNDADIAHVYVMYYKKIQLSLKPIHKDRYIWLAEILISHLIASVCNFEWNGLKLETLSYSSKNSLIYQLLENMCDQKFQRVRKALEKISGNPSLLFCLDCSSNNCEMKRQAWHIDLQGMELVEITPYPTLNNTLSRYRLFQMNGRNLLPILSELSVFYHRFWGNQPNTSTPTDTDSTEEHEDLSNTEKYLLVYDCIYRFMFERIPNNFCCYMVLVIDGPNMEQYTGSDISEYLFAKDVDRAIYVGHCEGTDIRSSHANDVRSAVNKVLTKTSKMFMLRKKLYDTRYDAKRDEAVVIETLKIRMAHHEDIGKQLSFVLLNRRSETACLMTLSTSEQNDVMDFATSSIKIFTHEDDAKKFHSTLFEGNYLVKTHMKFQSDNCNNLTYSQVKDVYNLSSSKAFT